MSIKVKGHFRNNIFLRIILVLGYFPFITVKLSCIEYLFFVSEINDTFMKELS